MDRSRMSSFLFVIAAALVLATMNTRTAWAGDRASVHSRLDRRSDVSPRAFEEYFRSKRVPGFRGLGDDFVAVGRKYQINAVYIMAHAALESGWGRSQIARDKKNLFGYGAYDRDPYRYAKRFPSFQDGIAFVMRMVRQNYLTKGGRYYGGEPTLYGMNKRYATDKGWSRKIAGIMNDFYRWLDRQTAGGRRDGKFAKYWLQPAGAPRPALTSSR